MSEEHPQYSTNARRLTLEALAQAAEPATAERLALLSGLDPAEIIGPQLAALEQEKVVACIQMPKRQPALWELIVSLGTVQQMLRAMSAGEAQVEAEAAPVATVFRGGVLCDPDSDVIAESDEPPAEPVCPVLAALLAAESAGNREAQTLARQADDLMHCATRLRAATASLPAIASAMRGLSPDLAVLALERAREALLAAQRQ